MSDNRIQHYFRHRTIIILGMVVLFTFPIKPIHLHAEDPVSRAIDLGIDFLLKTMETQQVSKDASGDLGNGQKALENYALIIAGVSENHPLIQKNFEDLGKILINYTYGASCYAFALDAAIGQIESDAYFFTGKSPKGDQQKKIKAYRDRLEQVVQGIVKMQTKNGAWHYNTPPATGKQTWDNSCVQFAVLALGVGAKHKIEIPTETWEKVVDHFIEEQAKKGPRVKERLTLHADADRGKKKINNIRIIDKSKGKNISKKKKKGKKKKKSKTTVGVPAIPEVGTEKVEVFSRGWKYSKAANPGYLWNMTCAGLSSQILAEQNLRGLLSNERREKLNKSIRDGYGYILKGWAPFSGVHSRYYGIYSIEKVADLGGVKKFGTHDWYREISDYIVANQLINGSWPPNLEEFKNRYNTAFALLVLNRATSLLTRRSKSDLIVFTGEGIRSDKTRHNWVYIQSLGRELHLPTLFRALEHRPNPRLAKYIKLAVNEHPEPAKLIPYLIEAKRLVKSKKFKRFLDRTLVEITQADYEDQSKYGVWFRRWKDVDEAGTMIQKDKADWLLQVYKTTNKSVPLRAKIIWALTRCEGTKATPLLIEDLRHTEQTIREAAYIALSSFPLYFNGGEPLPHFEADASDEDRAEQVTMIEAWYKKK